MYEPKIERDVYCPLEYGMDIFGGKWKPRIICILSRNGKMRYSEIKKELMNVTDTVLASTLKDMVASGMVLRYQYNEVPPRVEYALSDAGHSVMPIFAKICIWTGHYYKTSNDKSMCSKCDYLGPHTN